MFSTVCFKGYVCYFICSTKLKSLKKIEKNVSFHQKNSFYSRDIQLFLIFLFFFSNIFHSKKNLNNEMIILDYPETTVNQNIQVSQIVDLQVKNISENILGNKWKLKTSFKPLNKKCTNKRSGFILKRIKFAQFLHDFFQQQNSQCNILPTYQVSISYLGYFARYTAIIFQNAYAYYNKFNKVLLELLSEEVKEEGFIRI